MAIDINNLSGFDSLLEDDLNASPQENHQASFVDESLTPLDLEADDEEEIKENVQPSDISQEETHEDESAIYTYLRSLGIANPDKLQFENEDGEIEERSFNDLDKEEQVNVLKELSTTEAPDIEQLLSREEIDYINFARENNLSMEQLLNQYAEKYLQDYLTNNNLNVTDSIDNYTDEQLYLSDLAAKYPSFSDEELLSKLETAKQNEDLFTKEVTELRNYYKAQEQQIAQMKEEQKQTEIVDLKNTIVNAINDFNGIYLDYRDEQSDSIEIEDSDKEDIYAYLTSQGPDGLSRLAKDLQDPNALVEIAWFRTRGADLLSNVTRYWKDEVAKAHRENTRLQKELDKHNKNNDNKSFIAPTISKKPEKNSVASIWDKF